MEGDPRDQLQPQPWIVGKVDRWISAGAARGNGRARPGSRAVFRKRTSTGNLSSLFVATRRRSMDIAGVTPSSRLARCGKVRTETVDSIRTGTRSQQPIRFPLSRANSYNKAQFPIKDSGTLGRNPLSPTSQSVEIYGRCSISTSSHRLFKYSATSLR
jgi:hypothetical protein